MPLTRTYFIVFGPIIGFETREEAEKYIFDKYTRESKNIDTLIPNGFEIKEYEATGIKKLE